MGNVRVEDFGRDHWSLFAYLETRCVDYKGTVNGAHLRHNPAKRPAVVGSDTRGLSALVAGGHRWKPEYGTRLRGFWKDGGGTDPSRQIEDHDDIDCLEDLEEAGLVKNEGSGLNPLIRMTKEGSRVAGLLREHKANGGNFAEFEIVPEVVRMKKSEG
jgi:hypothetical protein